MLKELFGTLPSGENVYSYTLENKNGMSIKVIEYGAMLISIKVPTKNGEKEELTIGFDTLEDYLNQRGNFGSTVGRYANRIANAKFELDGVTYNLNENRPPNHQHGGEKGFGKVLWKAEEIMDKNTVKLRYFSCDGDQGYPGNLQVWSTYILTDENEIKMIYEAETDKTTPISMTNHAYFNLAGIGSENVFGHDVQIFADKIIDVDQNLIPTGKFKDVQKTIFDLREPKNIGKVMKDSPTFEGYDHCYAISNVLQNPIKLVATVNQPKNGRGLEVYTTQPGLQFYIGNFLPRLPIANGKIINKHGGFALETQNFPDGPNHKEFPSPFLKPGEKYHQETVYKILF